MNKKYAAFQKKILAWYQEHGRKHLPWREDQSPYSVLVSEVMLQQTQVDRVIPFFEKWMDAFPTWQALSRSPQSSVLKHWKGLGYNSRALRLQKLAKIVEQEYGELPSGYTTLLRLPGIGPYTAGAVRAFAFNLYTPIIETNIRRVFIHYFFKDRQDVSDAEIFEIMKDMGEMNNPREWYAALMDYGATLPKIVKYNSNTQSKHYTKQSCFEGSDRQIRGRILEILLNAKDHKMSEQKLFSELGEEQDRYKKIITRLEKENFLKKVGRSYVLK